MRFLFSGRKKLDKSIPQSVHKNSLSFIENSDGFPQSTEFKTKVKGEGSCKKRSILCLCCGSKANINDDWKKFRCLICCTTNYLSNEKPLILESSMIQSSQSQCCSLEQLKILIKQCYKTGLKTSTNAENITEDTLVPDFEPVTAYLSRSFHDINILEMSFLNLNSPIVINIDELKEFYSLIMHLPTRRPFYKMLCACNDLLKRPTVNIKRYRWILIIWEIPVIRNCLTFKNDSHGFDTFRIKSVAYELVKRCIGYLSHILNHTDSNNYQIFLTYLRYLPKELFLNHIETINLYLTYQLTKIYSNEVTFNKKTKNDFTNSTNTNNNDNDNNNSMIGLLPLSQSDNPTVIHTNDRPFASTTEQENTSNALDDKLLNIYGRKKNDQKYPMIKTFKYQNNWHLETAANLMKLYYLVNYKRVSMNSKKIYGNTKLNINSFYNIMLDFIDYKDDFNNWEGLEVKKKLDDIILIEEEQQKQRRKFTFCKYPFLLSLGVKISIMEYETRKIMEYHAEMAFLDSLDKGKNISVYFKIRVRRNHIVQDSLNVIKGHQGDFLKALRIEFINEKGVDAGGLRKEWFMLLTKKFFHKNSTLFGTVSESRYTWFIGYSPNSKSIQNKNLLHSYFLFGVVVGLAIFNGVILDLKFPRLFYKKMCNEQVTFADYLELYPETGKNLQKLLDYDREDFADVFSLTFETTIRDKNQFCSIELCSGGSNRIVTLKNKHEYVHLWMDYYLNVNVNEQFIQFMRGFNKVFDGCNSIKLFNSEELERLLCGDIQDKAYDFDVLRTVTKYKDGYTNETPVIEWFWEIISGWGIELQGKLLQFVTGSDRVPAIGINTLSFRISKLNENDDILLPVAHTCFNELSLPEYSNKKTLENKIVMAITECQGFEFR